MVGRVAGTSGQQWGWRGRFLGVCCSQSRCAARMLVRDEQVTSDGSWDVALGDSVGSCVIY